MSLRATCQCGQLTVELNETVTPAVVMCHCIDCQRRTGSPFGVVAFYDLEDATISGESKTFVRPTDGGTDFTEHFCGTCATTLYFFSDKHKGGIGVAVGAIADPSFHAPVRSVYEQSKHDWVTLPEGINHFVKGRTG